jgi:cytochrome c oxidase subunit 2
MPSAAPWGMPPNAALHGVAVDRLMHWDIGAMLVCFLLAHLLLVIALLRRRNARPQIPNPQVQNVPSASTSTWTVELVPLALLCVLYIAMAVTAEHLWAQQRFEGPAPAALHVEVVGQQFEWYFHYPGLDASFGANKPQLAAPALGNPLGLDPGDQRGRDDLVASELVLPANRQVDLQLRSLDVIHGFFIPAMRLKQNAVPGMLLHVHFTPIAEGSYAILCSQVCGSGHARMQARLRVVSSAEYAHWLETRTAAKQRAEVAQ